MSFKVLVVFVLCLIAISYVAAQSSVTNTVPSGGATSPMIQPSNTAQMPKMSSTAATGNNGTNPKSGAESLTATLVLVVSALALLW